MVLRLPLKHPRGPSTLGREARRRDPQHEARGRRLCSACGGFSVAVTNSFGQIP